MNDYSKRIRELRKSEKLHLTLEEFGKRLGVTKVAISNIENGNRNLTDQMKLAICREFHVNPEWLETGEGEMFQESSSTELQSLADRYNLEPEALILIEKFLDMRPEHQRVIIDYVKKAAESMEAGAADPDDEEALIEKQVEAYRKGLEMEKEAKARSEAS